MANLFRCTQKRKNMKAASLLLILSFALFSCSEEARLERQKSAYFKRFNALVEKVENKGADFSAKDWEATDEELDNFTGLEKNELQAVLTDEDRDFIRELENRYEKAYYKNVGNNLLKGIKRRIHEATKE
jgi:predicted mannosyl-3-phosphoglycerate phosphatase (HAD superfamily)